MEKVANFIDLVQRQQRNAETRRLIVLSGSHTWAQRQIAALETDLTDWLLIAGKEHGLPLHQSLKLVSGKQAHQVLGQEYPGIIFDAWSGFNPNAFGQVCGTLIAGGIMILITPPLTEWPDFDDPECLSLVTGSGSVAQVGQRFIQHLTSIIDSDAQICLLQQHHPLPEPFTETSVHASEYPDDSDLGTALTIDQQRVVADCIKHFTESEKQVAVITADRGRGKTAALGLIAARLLTSKALNIIVTAPGRGAVEPLFTMLKQHCSCSTASTSELAVGRSRLRFMLPDQLLNEAPAADLLLVDEAAAIPAPVLRQLLDYSQVIYASTIHGYEGTGQGFAVRFLDQLSLLRPEWRHLRMTRPIRWAEGDPLEAFCYRALLLDAEPAAVDVEQVSACQVLYRRLERDELLQKPLLLKHLFGLLILAHYRTTPGDLRIMLDSPNLQIWIAEICVDGVAVPVATALLAEEGPIAETLAQEIVAGRRRPKGQLIPQTLLAHSQLRDAGRYKGLRIMRIAVQPVLQRQGIGLKLIEAISEDSLQRGYDWLGTSFGLTAGLLKFWKMADMELVRLGYKRDKVSATHAAVMLKGLTPAAQDLQQRASQQCVEHLRQMQVSGSEVAASLLQRL
ncbi:MAG: GNAT family N-acetyltransferase [Amphritea sp.]|nr:GNAT family N-acetyltransferase [Amphritea sp.]